MTPAIETQSVRSRRRVAACVATLVAGTAALAWTIHIEPGDPRFLLAGVVLAAVWAGGALAGGLGTAPTGWPAGRALAFGAVLGVALLGLFLLGGMLVRYLPVLREPVQHLLAHGRGGLVGVVLLVTVLNGIAEELYFRGTLFATLPDRHAVVLSTLIYAAVTAVSGIVLLSLAALLLGALTAVERRITGSVLAPAVTHVVWSTGMLLLLPPVLGMP